MKNIKEICNQRFAMQKEYLGDDKIVNSIKPVISVSVVTYFVPTTLTLYFFIMVFPLLFVHNKLHLNTLVLGVVSSNHLRFLH